MRRRKRVRRLSNPCRNAFGYDVAALADFIDGSHYIDCWSGLGCARTVVFHLAG